MFLKRIGWIGVTFATAWLISFALSFWVTNSAFWQDVLKKPLANQNLQIGQAQTVGMIPGKTKIEEEIYYSRCKHLEKREIIAEDVFPGYSEESLKAQGWNIYHNGNQSMTIFRNVNGLCSDDINKRHLGVSGENVSIIEGPVGVEGNVLKVLDIKVAKLPIEWQEKVRKGLLNFSSEQELLEALDSIDEYE